MQTADLQIGNQSHVFPIQPSCPPEYVLRTVSLGNASECVKLTHSHVVMGNGSGFDTSKYRMNPNTKDSQLLAPLNYSRSQ